MTKTSKPKRRKAAGLRAVHANIDPGVYDLAMKQADGRSFRAVLEMALALWAEHMRNPDRTIRCAS